MKLKINEKSCELGCFMAIFMFGIFTAFAMLIIKMLSLFWAWLF